MAAPTFLLISALPDESTHDPNEMANNSQLGEFEIKMKLVAAEAMMQYYIFYKA